MRFLKSLPLYIGLTLLATTVPLAAQAGSTESYKVELNKTEIVRLPGAAASVIVGNPKIADVTVQSSNLLFVVGRGYGETNLIILDSSGNTMMNADLQVVNTLPRHGVRLYNGKNRETYSCIPYCGPSPVLGDNRGFIGNNTSREAELDTIPAFVAQQTQSPSATASTSGSGLGSASASGSSSTSPNQLAFENQAAGSAFNAQAVPTTPN